MSASRCQFPILLASIVVLAAPAEAQTYPDRVVRIVNPYPPGGSVDITARILAQKLAENTGQHFIVENRTGAGGNTGATGSRNRHRTATRCCTPHLPPLVINQTLYSKGLPFDPVRDFVPIAVFAYTPIVLMVHPGVPAKDVKELIAYAKNNPGKVHFGSAGIGTTPHLSGELFKSMSKIEITHVPYRGTGPAMQDLVGGHIQMFFDLLPASLPQINAGTVRALANAGATRASALSTLPTVAEQGLPGFDSASWVALVAPARTPGPVVARLREEVAKVLTAPDVVARIRELGSEPGTAAEKDIRAFLDRETTKWAEVIRSSGAKAD